jgi:hypothetical protein
VHRLITPIPEGKVDQMLDLIKGDWKGVGHKCHKWIEQVYFNLKDGTDKG